MLDDETAERFRAQGLLRAVAETDLAGASLTARALREPFWLFRGDHAEIQGDAIAKTLTNRQPVVDLEYAGHAFQLRLLTSAP